MAVSQPEGPTHLTPRKSTEAPSAAYLKMAGEVPRPPSPGSGNGKLGRSSFSSIREHDSDLAQTFTSSKVSSYNRAPEDAVAEDLADGSMISVQSATALGRPHSKLHRSWYAAGSFHGWEEIDVKGSLSTKGSGGFEALNLDGTGDQSVFSDVAATEPTVNDAALLENLPIELYSKFFSATPRPLASLSRSVLISGGF